MLQEEWSLFIFAVFRYFYVVFCSFGREAILSLVNDHLQHEDDDIRKVRRLGKELWELPYDRKLRFFAETSQNFHVDEALCNLTSFACNDSQKLRHHPGNC